MEEWVLCFTVFKDIMQIAPKGLNHKTIESNYEEASFRHIKKTYFNHLRYIENKTTKKHNVTINQITT